MSAFNILYAEARCPRCNQTAKVSVTLKVGLTDQMLALRLGDTYSWCPGRSPQNGGRPDGPRFSCHGYAECSSCRQDFIVEVLFEGDVICGVRPDHAFVPYSFDSELIGAMPCPNCEKSAATRLQVFEGLPFARLLCDHSTCGLSWYVPLVGSGPCRDPDPQGLFPEPTARFRFVAGA